MASELRVDTLKDSSGNNSVGMAYVAEGSAKMWTTTNQSTGSIKDSFNTASITDNGTGNFTNTATSALDNANYSVAGTNVGDTQGSYGINVAASGVANATTAHRYTCINTITDGLLDAVTASTIVHGDLA